MRPAARDITDEADETVMLLATVFVLTAIDWVCYFVLETGNPVAFGPPPRIAVLDGFTQSVAVRSAGFYINAPSTLEPANQVLYVFMMVRGNDRDPR